MITDTAPAIDDLSIKVTTAKRTRTKKVAPAPIEKIVISGDSVTLNSYFKVKL